jgi:hypothetical protein
LIFRFNNINVNNVVSISNKINFVLSVFVLIFEVCKKRLHRNKIKIVVIKKISGKNNKKSVWIESIDVQYFN